MKILKAMLALVAIILVIAWQADVFKAKQGPGSVADERPKANPEAVISATERELPEIHHLAGHLVARAPVSILARTAGELQELFVQAGDRVKAGELLVVLNSDRLRARRDEAAAALAVAEAEKEGAARLSRRIEAAAEAQALAETEAIDARRALKSSTRRVEQASAALRAAEVGLDDARLRSPIDGIVIDSFKDPGNWLAPGQPILSLFDPGQLEIEVGVPGALAHRLEPGRLIPCYIEALGTEVTAKVRTLVPQADPASRTVLVKLALDPPEGALPGMFVRADLEGKSRTVVMIPQTAVREVRQLDFVSAVDADGRITPHWVRLGAAHDDSVSILAGLRPGDRVLRHYGAPDGPEMTPDNDLSDHE